MNIRKNVLWSLRPTKLECLAPVPSDIKIVRSVVGKPISDLCNEIGIDEQQFDLYGKFKCKILRPFSMNRNDQEIKTANYANYVVVTGITPTSLGEGKSTTTIGLTQALGGHIGRNSIACIRQPSQGPTFGMKGGAAGGGYSQVWPMDEFNMHLTGDVHAVTAANNLIAAAIDARIFHESTQNDSDLFLRLVSKSKNQLEFTETQKLRLKKLGIDENLKPEQLNDEQRRKFSRLNIDPDSVTWTRVVDTNDRFLRQITIGQAPTEKGRTRKTKFAISVASELMAILALGQDFCDICERVSKIVIGFTLDTKKPITCSDLCVDGAVNALLKDCCHPTLMQTLEGTPVLVHCGPFANIAHGSSSIIADHLAMELVGQDGFVVTECGFASDIGLEKFINIKCRYSNMMPHCAVLVVSVRAIKMHGYDILESDQSKSSETNKIINEELILKSGLINVRAHIENIRNNFNVSCVVALNKFTQDKQEEIDMIHASCLQFGADEFCVTDNWSKGGQGAIGLAKGVIRACQNARSNNSQSNNGPKFLYNLDQVDNNENKILHKLRKVATRVYKAKDISLTEHALNRLKLLEDNGFDNLPICIAKTQMSISHDPKLKGAPEGYIFPIIDVNVSAGAGFVYALAGEISTMPGLPTRPAFFDITIDPTNGKIDGLI